jgi:hypothetical protein
MEHLLLGLFLGGSFFTTMGGWLWVKDLLGRKKLPQRKEKGLMNALNPSRFQRNLLNSLVGRPPSGRGPWAILFFFIFFFPWLFTDVPSGGRVLLGLFFGGLGIGAGMIVMTVGNDKFFMNAKENWEDWYTKQTRRAALKALTTLPPSKTIPALTGVINQLPEDAFRFLLPHLKKLLPKQVMAEVMMDIAQKNNHRSMRQKAMEILAWHFPAKVEQHMELLLSSKDPKMRKITYNTLLRLPRSRTAQWLAQGQNDPSLDVSDRVREITKELNSRTAWPDFGEDGSPNEYGAYLPEVKAFWDGYLSATWEESGAIRALTENAQMEDWIQYLQILKDAPEEPFMVTVIRMMESHHSYSKITEALLELLLHEDPAISQAAENALEAKGHVPIQAIRAHWEDIHWSLREKLIQKAPELKKLEYKDVYRTFLTALQDEHDSTRLATLESIESLNNPRLLNLLLTHCRNMPHPKTTAYQDSEWVVARQAITHWVNTMPVRAEHIHKSFCTACNTRGTLYQRYIWKIPGCRKCNKFETLLANIEEVVGRIGPPLDQVQPMGTAYYLDIWNQTSRSATYADVDRVEVVGGGEIEYDWAVTAVLEALKNSDQPERGDVPFTLVDEPAISVNTARMIQGREVEP